MMIASTDVPEVPEPSEVRVCRAVLNRSIDSFFRGRPRKTQNLVIRLLAADVQLVIDLLKVGPTRLRIEFKATPDTIRHVTADLSEGGLEFTDAVAVMLKALDPR